MSNYYVVLLIITSLNCRGVGTWYNYIGLSWHQNSGNGCSAGAGCQAVHSDLGVYLLELQSFSFRCKMSCVWYWVRLCSQAVTAEQLTQRTEFFVIFNLQFYRLIETCASVPAIQGFEVVVMEIK